MSSKKSLNDVLLPNVNKRRQLAPKFQRIFGIPLNARFFNNLTGFDVIAFDEFIAPDENESCAEAVKRKYGEDALALVKGLM